MREKADFDSKNAFRTLHELCEIGPRVVGSEGEARAAAMVREHLEEYDLEDVTLLTNPIRSYNAVEARVSTLDDRLAVSGVPCWMSPSTPSEGIIASTIYVGSRQNISTLSKEDVKDRLAFVLMAQQYMPEVLEAWDHLFDMKPAGVVFLDLERNQAPRTYNYEKMNHILSRAPCMTASAHMAEKIHGLMFGDELKLTIQGSPVDSQIRNVCGRLPGRTDETVVICAHLDTVPLTMGATDNAAGVSIMVELARVLSQQDNHYSYLFIAFSGEELEMKGSQSFLATQDVDDLILCMNFDSVAALPATILALSAGDDDMIEWITELAEDNPYPALCMRVATSGGDNIPFAAHGIPTIHFASHGPTSEKVSHSSIDHISLLSSGALGEVGMFALRLITKLDASRVIPFSLDVPDDLQEAARNRLGF